jgi:hypothetical protein
MGAPLKTTAQLIDTMRQSIAEANRVLSRNVLSPDAIRVIAAQLNQANNAAQRLQGVSDETTY